MKELAGKTAIVTGAGRGLGRAIALSLADCGVSVVLIDLESECLAETAGVLEHRGARVLSLLQDISESDAFEKIRDSTLEKFGQVDIVVNNAALLCSGTLEDIPIDQWEKMVAINLLAVARSCKMFAPDMIKRASGHIVNTSSFAGLYPYSVDRMPYVTTKGALVSLTESLALYLKPKGVGVTLLLPGPVSTGMRDRAQHFSPHVGLRYPKNAFDWRTPEEVGEMVVQAIRKDIFFLPTDNKVLKKMQEHAADPERFIAEQIAELAAE